MNRQKKQMLIVVILLVICILGYVLISQNADRLESTESDGPSASMGNVTESLLETETETEEATETVTETEEATATAATETE